MRILFVSWRDLANPSAGGSEVVVDVLATSLRARGHEVSLLCGGPVAPRPYEVVDNGGKHTQYLRAPLAYLRRFRDVDLVVDVANGMTFMSPLWRRGPRVLFVHHVHTEQWGMYFPGPVAAVARQAEIHGLPALYRNTHMVAVSPSTGDELEALGVDRSHIHVVNNGVHVEPLAEPVARSATPMFVALGRLAANKRIDVLLDVWAKVAQRTGGKLVIVGDGPDAARIAARVRTEPALADVVLEGRVDEARKAELLHQSWFLLHAAEREGWGLAILEAGVCGTPSLAYRVPGVRDAVVDGVTGVLVDTDDQLAEEWVALADAPARREALGRAAAMRAAEFTWEAAVEGFLEVAELAIASHGTAATKHRVAS
ncbi:MAG TPA: glycosyltransferase family 4 protein [Acidimicrobiia bacterium]